LFKLLIAVSNFSPRVSAVYSVGKHKEHNFRVSYQTGFRNPSTQELYIGLNLGAIALVGSAPDNLDRYHETVIATDPGTGTHFDADVSGTDAYTNSYTLASFQKFGAAMKAGDPNAVSYLKKAELELIKPEQLSTIEFGYRGKLMKKLGVDFSVYYNKYNNFSSSTRVMALSHDVGDVDDATAFNAIGTGAYKPFQVYTNAKTVVESYGLDVGFSYKFNNYRVGLIYDYAGLDFDKTVDPDFRSGFNTPEHRVKFSLGNDNFYKNIGFNVNFRYQTAFMWEASFAIGEVPARSILDAQINYNLKKYNMKFKAGGTNLLGTEYMSAPGAGLIGSMYYLGVTYGK
jgi:outer membrane receptor protein involved in Fe transport